MRLKIGGRDKTRPDKKAGNKDATEAHTSFPAF